MYEIFAIFIAGVIALMGVGGLELTLSYQRGNISHLAAREAARNLDTGEQYYVGQVAAWSSQNANATNITPYSGPTAFTSNKVQTCPAAGPGGVATTPTRTDGRTVSINGANGSACNYYASYTVSTAGVSTTASTGSDISQNVNIYANEQRFNGIIISTITNTAGTILAKKTRTITVRSFSLAPYAAVINSSETQDPFLASNTGLIGAAGTLSEGDNSNSANRTIYSYAGCNDTSVSVSQKALYDKWCQNQALIARPSGAENANYNPNLTAQSYGGSYSATATPPPTASNININTTTSNQQNYTNGAGTANAGN